MKIYNLAEKNGMWRGDNVGYASLHIWVAKRKKKPIVCNKCKKSPPYDLANKGIYNRKLKNWEWLCRRCHMKKDGRSDKLHTSEIRKKACITLKKTWDKKGRRTKEEKILYLKKWKEKNPNAYKIWYQENKEKRNIYMKNYRAKTGKNHRN
jgi:hypothetical protein